MKNPADSALATVAYGQDYRPAQAKQARPLEVERVLTRIVFGDGQQRA